MPGTEAERDGRAEVGERPGDEAAVYVSSPDADAAPLDMMGIAGNAVYKRVIPVVVVLVVVVAVVIYLVVS